MVRTVKREKRERREEDVMTSFDECFSLFPFVLGMFMIFILFYFLFFFFFFFGSPHNLISKRECIYPSGIIKSEDISLFLCVFD